MAEERAESMARLLARPPPRVLDTRVLRWRPRIKLGTCFPTHNDKMDLHPLKPFQPWTTTSLESLPPYASYTEPLAAIRPHGYVELPRRATPPGKWVPGGHPPIAITNFELIKRTANCRAQMMMPLGNERPSKADIDKFRERSSN